MIDFKIIAIEDKSWIDPLLAAAEMRGCQHNFTNLFAWSNIYNYYVAQVGDFLVVKGESPEKVPGYLYPAGRGNPGPVLTAMSRDALNCGSEFRLVGLSPENIAVLTV